jgi:GTP cyclohydrolase I
MDEKIKLENIQKSIFSILESIGEDPTREGLIKTPQRVAKLYQELTEGYDIDQNKLVNGALFEVEYQETILIKDIEFFSLCEHHLLPFFGKVHICYIPRKKVLGLSKFPRIVEMFSKRLQMQERLTSQIAKCIEEVLDPIGFAIYIESSHLCSSMRGIKKSKTKMTTCLFHGIFKSDPLLQQQFFSQIQPHHKTP